MVTWGIETTEYTSPAIGFTFGWAEGARFWEPFILLQLFTYGVAVGWGREVE